MKLRNTPISMPAQGVWLDGLLSHAPDVRGLAIHLHSSGHPPLGAVTPPPLQFSEAVPVGALVILCVLLTVQAGTVFDYLDRTTAGLLRSGDYAARVLGEPPVLRAPGAEGAR